MSYQTEITLDGFSLSIQDVLMAAVKNGNGDYPKISIAESARLKVQTCAEFIRRKAEDDKEIVYGVTTGFGSKADTAIELDHAKELQRNLLLSHSTGVGERLPVAIVRAMMVIRLNTLLQGHSGVHVKTVELLKDCINHEIHPVVPSQGSVGASGDLCPLSHLALPLIGEGEVTIGDGDLIISASVALQQKKLQPIELSYKEGLALNNGTTLMTALGAIAVHEAKQLLQLAAFSSALTFEALCARSDAYDYDPIHNVRNHDGQIRVALWLKTALAGSTHIDIQMSDILNNDALKQLIARYQIPSTREAVTSDINEIINAERHKQKVFSPELFKCIPSVGAGSEWKAMLEFAKKKFKPQDAYSIRCAPQVFGAALAAIEHVEQTISNELNAAVDNPLLFLKELHDVDEDRVISGGNFHGEPIAMPLDYLKLAVAEIGSIVERQINKLVDSSTNDGLPSFLVNSSGLNSGLMIPQYVAASLASENKVLVHPASADSIPTCENTEDHVSMGPIAGRQALQIIENVKRIVAISMLTAYQGVAMRKQQFQLCNITVQGEPPKLSPVTYELYKEIERILSKFNHGNDWLSKDRYLAPEIQEILSEFPALYKLTNKYI